MNALKLYTNGTIMPYEINEEGFEYKYQALQNAINCNMIDIIHAVNLPSPYCLVVDDEALLKEEPTVNVVASYLYGTAEHKQPLCGDVLIMKDKATPDGIETVGLDESDMRRLEESLIYSKDFVGGIRDTIEVLKEIIGGGENA